MEFPPPLLPQVSAPFFKNEKKNNFFLGYLFDRFGLIKNWEMKRRDLMGGAVKGICRIWVGGVCGC